MSFLHISALIDLKPGGGGSHITTRMLILMMLGTKKFDHTEYCKRCGLRKRSSQRVRQTEIGKKRGKKGWTVVHEEEEFSRPRKQRPCAQALS